MMRYLRTIVPGAGRDPTMTYVDDLSAFVVDDVLISYDGVERITAIDTISGRRDVCIVHTTRSALSIDQVEQLCGSLSVHDLRASECAMWTYMAQSCDGQPLAEDAVRARWASRGVYT